MGEDARDVGPSPVARDRSQAGDLYDEHSGLTFADIGDVTGTSAATIASRYRLGFEKMAQALSQEKST